MVVQAMSRFKDVKGEWLRFHTVVESIKDEQNFDYLITCLSFVNSIVNFPKEIEIRVGLRNEFIRLGILDILKELRNNYEYDEDLVTHLNIFDEFMEIDNVEINKGMECLQGIDQNDPSQIFDALKKKTIGSNSYNSFLFILKNILLMSADVTVGLNIFKIMEKVMAQYIDLQKGGITEDEVRQH
jgi:hypothetical protein